MYIGIDLGTSGLKSILISDDQSLIGSASADLNVRRPHAGWSEQCPVSWIAAAENTLQRLKQDHPEAMANVRSIGLAGHMHGATLLDVSGNVLRPCMLWNDTRSHSQAAAMDADMAFRTISGNVVFPGFTAPKLAWVRENEPKIFAKIAKVLLPKDFLRFWLTGEYVSEMSDAAGTAWLDVGNRDWSDILLDKTNLSKIQMPSLVEGSEVSGILKNKLADQFGLPKGVLVAGGAGDNAVAACGLGVVDNGQAFVSLGTSGVLFAANDAYRPKPESAVHTFCHAVPNTWHQMGVILSATDCLNWFADLNNAKSKDLVTACGSKLAAPRETMFLPYLSGERTPYNDVAARGAFIGLSHSSDSTALTRAVLEGVSFALKDNLIALSSTGTQVQHLLATGGGSQSDYWLHLLATVLNIPIARPENSELGAALGAARLAMAASGVPIQDAMQAVRVSKVFTPQENLIDDFNNAHKRFTLLYTALKYF